jgi:hypothetical protein
MIGKINILTKQEGCFADIDMDLQQCFSAQIFTTTAHLINSLRMKVQKESFHFCFFCNLQLLQNYLKFEYFEIPLAFLVKGKFRSPTSPRRKASLIL